MVELGWGRLKRILRNISVHLENWLRWVAVCLRGIVEERLILRSLLGEWNIAVELLWIWVSNERVRGFELWLLEIRLFITVKVLRI
jgi:hypothetical protein